MSWCCIRIFEVSAHKCVGKDDPAASERQEAERRLALKAEEDELEYQRMEALKRKKQREELEALQARINRQRQEEEDRQTSQEDTIRIVQREREVQVKTAQLASEREIAELKAMMVIPRVDGSAHAAEEEAFARAGNAAADIKVGETSRKPKVSPPPPLPPPPSLSVATVTAETPFESLPYWLEKNQLLNLIDMLQAVYINDLAALLSTSKVKLEESGIRKIPLKKLLIAIDNHRHKGSTAAVPVSLSVAVPIAEPVSILEINV